METKEEEREGKRKPEITMIVGCGGITYRGLSLWVGNKEWFPSVTEAEITYICVDPDILTEENRRRQWSEARAGTLKTNLVGAFLQSCLEVRYPELTYPPIRSLPMRIQNFPVDDSFLSSRVLRVICAPDNHPARLAVLRLVEMWGLTGPVRKEAVVILAGNERDFGQATYSHWIDGLWVHETTALHKEIVEDREEVDVHVGCGAGQTAKSNVLTGICVAECMRVASEDIFLKGEKVREVWWRKNLEDGITWIEKKEVPRVERAVGKWETKE